MLSFLGVPLPFPVAVVALAVLHCATIAVCRLDQAIKEGILPHAGGPFFKVLTPFQSLLVVDHFPELSTAVFCMIFRIYRCFLWEGRSVKSLHH